MFEQVKTIVENVRLSGYVSELTVRFQRFDGMLTGHADITFQIESPLAFVVKYSDEADWTLNEKMVFEGDLWHALGGP